MISGRSGRPHHAARRVTILEHDPEKWVPVFRKRSCSNKKIERDDDSKKSRHALAYSGFLELAKHLIAAFDGRIQSLLGGFLACQRLLDLFRPYVTQLDHVAEPQTARILARLLV